MGTSSARPMRFGQCVWNQWTDGRCEPPLFYRYAYIEIDGCDAQQTKCISGTLNPEWNETRGPASFLSFSESSQVDCALPQVHVQDRQADEQGTEGQGATPASLTHYLAARTSSRIDAAPPRRSTTKT